MQEKVSITGVSLLDGKIEHRSKMMQKEWNWLKAGNFNSLANKKGLKIKGSEDQTVPLLVELMERHDADRAAHVQVTRAFYVLVVE
ncbi:hypothetical protein SLA2020_107010 [Shorea laevis]